MGFYGLLLHFSLVISIFHNVDCSTSMFETVDKSSWIDPGHMFEAKIKTGNDNKAPSNLEKNPLSVPNPQPVNPPIANEGPEKDVTLLYFERYVKHILHLLKYNNDLHSDTYRAEFRITKAQVKILQTFVNSNFSTLGTIQEVDTILSEIITNISPATSETASNQLFNNFNIDSIGIEMVTYVSAGCSVLWLFGNPFRARSATVRLLILFVFASGVAVFRTYQNMKQEIEATTRFQESQILEEPIECRPQEMTYTQSFFSNFQMLWRDNPCEVYHKRIHVDPTLKVNVVKAFIETLFDTLMVAVERVAEGTGRAIQKFVNGMPWYISLLIVPGILLYSLQYLNVLVWIKTFYGIFGSQQAPARNAIEDVRDPLPIPVQPVPVYFLYPDNPDNPTFPHVAYYQNLGEARKAYKKPKKAKSVVKNSPKENPRPSEPETQNSDGSPSVSSAVESQQEAETCYDVNWEYEVLTNEDVLSTPD